MSSNSVLYRFGPFEADLAKGELRKYGLPIRLQPKPWRLLLALLSRPGEVLTRADLHELLWDSDIVVDFEAGLNVAVKKLRAALNDSSDNPTYIETVAGAGYRFIGKLERTVETSVSELEIEIASDKDVPAESPSPAIYVEQGSSLRLGIRRVLVLAIITAGVVLGLTSFTFIRKSSQQQPAPSKKMKVVVLPFENLTGDISQEYLADGITEELSEKLGNFNPQQLSVIGRTSAMAYKGSKRTITDIGKDLSVDYVLEGSMRRQGRKLRITAQLVEVADQAHLWAEEYDRNTQDLFEVEDEIAAEIAHQVGASLALTVQKRSGHIPSSAAHEDYLVGRYYWYERTPEGWSKAEHYFRRAIIEDPRYAAAYAGLAECVDRSEALQAAQKAVELDPSSAEAYTALGWVELYRNWDFNIAAAALQTAIRLDPNYAPAYHVYSSVLEVSGQFQDAIQEEKQAIQIDPLSFIFRAALAQSLSAAGQNGAAIATIKEIFNIDPRYPKAHETLGLIYLSTGKYREAISQFEMSEQYGGVKSPEFVAYAYARMGNKDQALRMLSGMQNSPDYQDYFETSIVELGLGNNQQAIESLEKSCQEHADDSMLWLKTSYIFDPLRSDPRFKKLLERISSGQCAKV